MKRLLIPSVAIMVTVFTTTPTLAANGSVVIKARHRQGVSQHFTNGQGQ